MRRSPLVYGFGSHDLRNPVKQPAELDYARDYFFGGLKNRDPLAGSHRDDRIRGHFDVFNQVAVDYECCVVESCEPYHCLKTFLCTLCKNKPDLADEVFEGRPSCH